MAGFLERLRSWWNRDAREIAEEETRGTQHERDLAREDFEARKDDLEAESALPAGAADFERDSEPPPAEDER